MAVNIGPRIGIDGEAEYRRQLQSIIQQTRTLKTEYDKVSSSMEKGKTTLKGNAEQQRILTEQIKKQEEVVKQNAKMLDEARSKYDKLDNEIKIATANYGENSEEVKALTTEQNKAAESCEKWEQNTNKAVTSLNNMKSQLAALPSSIELVGQKMETVGNSIKSVGSGMSNFGMAIAPVSAAAAAGLTAAGKSFMDFESGMSKVAAISGATGSDLDMLTEKAKEMGASTKFSATESAEAFSYMAMAGWKTEQMLDGIAPVMNLAAASGEELGSVSDIVTDALTAFGLKASDAGHFADILAAASSNSNTNVAMLGESFKYAASMAGSMGYSAEDTALALGLMANSGIKASMAGTSLRNIMQRMAKPTKESQAAIDRLGLSLTDGEGNMLSFRQILDQMRSSFGQINMPIEEFDREVAELNQMLEDGDITEKKYTDALAELAKQAYGAEGAEKARAAAMLAGSRAMPALLSMVNASSEDYNKLSAAIDNSSIQMAKLADGSIVPLNEALASGQQIIEQYNGTAEQMAEIMQDNAAGAWVEAKSAMEGAAIEAGEVLAPYIIQAADAVKELANWFSSLDSAQQETIVKTAALVAAAGPALIMGGKMTSGIGSLVSGGGQLMQMLGKLAPAAGGASSALAGTGGSAAAAGASIGAMAVPIAAAVAALALLGGAFVTAYQSDAEFAAKVQISFLEIKNSFTSLINTIKPAWEAFSQFLGPVFIAAMDMIKRTLDNLRMNIQGWIDIIAGIFTGDWGRVWTGAKEVVFSGVNMIINKIEYMRDIVEGIFKNLNIQLPHIKLPHFSVTGSDSFGLPKLKIDWYAKAMQNGMRLNGATIFGVNNGQFMGGGEVGPEWVVGESSLMGMVKGAVRSSMGYVNGGNTVNIGDTNIIINGADQSVEEIADRVDEIITLRLQQAEAAWA